VWVNCSASPVAGTNQFLIEDVSQVIKEKYENASNQCQISKHNNNKKLRGKSMPMFRGGVSNWEGKRYEGKEGH